MKKFGHWMLSLFCNPEYLDDISGDLEELYTRRKRYSGEIKAGFMYLMAVVMLLRPSLIKPFKLTRVLKNNIMIKQYIKSASRSFIKYKSHSFINVFGLSIGIAAAILLYGYVSYELSYDKGYKNQQSIYRVTNHSKFGNRERTGITGSGLLGPTIEEEIPEVKIAGRRHYFGQPIIQSGNKKFRQYGVYYADPNLTEILEYKYLNGSPQTALATPNSVVLSKTLAMKIFDDNSDVVGQNLVINNTLMQITGVIADVPPNSNFVPKALISMSSMKDISWERMGTVTYVLLENEVSPKWVDEKMKSMVERLKLGNPDEGFHVWFDLFPIADIHLSTNTNQSGRGDLNMVYAFSIIAIFIILIASVNYMNLATARASQRAKEIGIRKAIGALREQITFQFLTESFIISIISVIIGVFIAITFQDSFIQLMGIPSTIIFLNIDILLKLLVFALIVGLISGIYPAVVLSSFKPVSIIKGLYSDKGNKGLRRILVIFQFVISSILVISTLVIYDQLNYVQNKDLGYNKGAVYIIRLREADSNQILKSKLLQNANIKSVAASNLMPATGDSGATCTIQNEEGEISEDNVSMASIDNDYLQLMEMELLKGKTFSKNNGTNENSIIVNQALIKKYGWKEPIGQHILIESDEDEEVMEKFIIQGIVKDFNMLSLYDPIQPFAFFKKPKFDWGAQYLFIKLQTDQLAETIGFIQKTFEEFDEQDLFHGRFLDVHLQNTYIEEQKQAEMFVGFSILTIIIACLGLFGLTSYTLERRTKEISIRKILGANLKNIIILVSTEFILIILIAGIIASPLVYYFMQDWLNTFSYHVEVTVFNILLGITLALGMAILTISLQAGHVSKSNPVNTLRHE